MWAAIVILIIVLIYIFNQAKLINIPAGTRQWRVLESYSNPQAAAELLNRTNKKLIEFMRFVKNKYHIDETDDQIAAEGQSHQLITSTDAYKIIYALTHGYNPDVFYENAPGGDGTAYTMNKGEKMYICLRDINNHEQLIDEHILLFVMLHEMSHIGNYNGWGHDTRFWEVFKFILHEAVESGIYEVRDYSIRPQNYCGLEITYNPLLDNGLKNIWQQ
jgi:hypothetical protein